MESWRSGLLFANLPEHVCDLMVSRAKVIDVQKNAQLCTEGRPAGHLFLIKRGQARFCRLNQNGKETILYWLAPGDTFGLGTLLSRPEPYFGSASSVSTCRILSWDHHTIRGLAHDVPQIACNAIGIVMRYLAIASERHARIFGNSARDRIARTLIDLGKRTGDLSAGGVDLQITNEELASLADVSPFTVSRTLSEWNEEGAVTKARKALHINAPEKLVRHAHYAA
jgi:CRP-like cAMP-binding protein